MNGMTHTEAREVVDDLHAREMRPDDGKMTNVDLLQQNAVRQHLGDVLVLAIDQIVDNHDPLAPRRELTHELGADETGAARDENRVACHASRVPGCGPWPSRQRRNFAGTPATIEKGGTSFVTTAPAPIMAPRPTVPPGMTIAFTPMSAHAPIRTGR